MECSGLEIIPTMIIYSSYLFAVPLHLLVPVWLPLSFSLIHFFLFLNGYLCLVCILSDTFSSQNLPLSFSNF